MFSRRVAAVIVFTFLLAPLVASEREPGMRREHERDVQPADPIEDCLQFNCESIPSSITRDNVADLQRAWNVKLPDIADGAPIFVSRALTAYGIRDLLIVSTMGGHLIALDPAYGSILWETTPPNGPRWTTASPAVDPNRNFVYSYGLDGYVHRYSIADGSEIEGGGWPELVTLKPAVEKCSSALSVVTTKSGANYLYATIAAYPDPGDDGDYQGHLVAIDLDSGEQHVFNALCSDNDRHFIENGSGSSDCAAQQAGIWARAGAVYDDVTDRTYITVGNGPFDADRGGFNWGTSVVALRPDGTSDHGTPLDSFTPADYQQLTDKDLDLSSTTVAVLPLDFENPRRLAVQGGKDGHLRLLDLRDLSGMGGPRHVGGEMQNLGVSTGGAILTRPATWLADDGTTWVFVTTHRGLSAYSLAFDTAKGTPQLIPRWQKAEGGTSPIVDGGVLVYARDHEVRALDPETGELLWNDTSIGTVHWESPIVVGDTIYVPDHENGLSAFRLPQ
jgi:outer membrane protein assembly factor BamB